MKMKLCYGKRLWFILFCIWWAGLFVSAFAQTASVYGTIRDKEKNTCINYANILVFSTDSVFIKGAITDAAGNYALDMEEGEYGIQVKALGFKNLFYTLRIPRQGLQQDFYMEMENVALGEVVVTGKEPLVKREADRLIFDAKQVAAGSHTALDLLKNVPGVMVVNGEIKILGQAGVKVLVNEKDQKLNGEELLTLLKSYQAEQVDKIEVIVTPPSQYDAEGNAGILHIRLKKARIDYMGSVWSYGYGYDKHHTNETNATFLYNRHKVNASVNAGGWWGKNRYKETNQEEHADYKRDNTSRSVSKPQNYNIRAALDYQLNKNIVVGVLGSYNRNETKSRLYGTSGFHTPTEAVFDSLLLSVNPGKTVTNNYWADLYSDIKLDTLGKTLHLDVDYTYSDYKAGKIFFSETYDPAMNPLGGEYGFNNDNTRTVRGVTSSLDFRLPINGFVFTLGTKLSFTETNNRLLYYNQPLLEDQNNDFSFKENIYAFYLDLNKRLTSKLSMQAGARVEHTYTKGTDRTGIASSAVQNKDTYTRLFPAFYMGYTPTGNHQFNFSFSSRISRPSFRNINPFVLYTNKYSTVSGKPDLKPSYFYRLNAGYTFKGNLSLDLFYAYSADGITQVQKMDSANLVMQTFWDNVLKMHRVGVTNTYFFNAIPWLQVFLIQEVSYEKSLSDSFYTLPKRNTWTYVAMMNTSIFFNRPKTWTGWLNASFNSAEKLATVDLRPSYNLNIGTQYSLLDNNLKLSVSMNNLIASHVKGVVNSNDFNMLFDNTYYYPQIKFSVTYILGAKLSGKRMRKTEMQERL